MPKNEIAISVKNVSKTFRLPHDKQKSLKGAFLNSFKKKTYEKQKALKDTSFDIKKGEFFGIVGKNGSGKSTLLKCIAGVYSQDSGTIEINGKLVPFIELGVGFNPELSGKDNVYLNGALLGFNRRQMSEMYDDIVEFAELENFMDQKLKNYSSGMKVRLAFSIAIRAKADILLLDEVLAVGDYSFQQKCFDYFEEMKRDKRTVILVTHSMASIEEYCDRALMLDKGRVKKIGSSEEISYLYTEENMSVRSEEKLKNTREKSARAKKQQKIEFTLEDEYGLESSTFEYGSKAVLKIKWQNSDIKNVGVALIKQTGGYVFGANTILDDVKVKNNEVVYTVELDLGDGNYYFRIGFFGEDDSNKIDFVDDGPSVIIKSKIEHKWGGTHRLNHSWDSYNV